MDKAVVCAKTRPSPAVQEPENQGQLLGGHDPVNVLPGDWETEQEGWFLLQVVSPDGAVDLGATRTR